MQDSASSVDAETLACLRSHFTELHTLFTGLMDAQGHAALSELRNAVVDAAGEWGLNPEAVRTLICLESLFTGVYTRISRNCVLMQPHLNGVRFNTPVNS